MAGHDVPKCIIHGSTCTARFEGDSPDDTTMHGPFDQVEFVDGSVKAQLGMPDMKIPIQYALTYPRRATSLFKRVDFSELKEMQDRLLPAARFFDACSAMTEIVSKAGSEPKR